jgi:hypothetical protein
MTPSPLLLSTQANYLLSFAASKLSYVDVMFSLSKDSAIMTCETILLEL